MAQTTWNRNVATVVADCLDCCFPSGCLLCREIMDSAPHRGGICDRCLLKMCAKEHVCARCSAPLPSSVPIGVDCLNCRGCRWAFQRAYALGPYRDLLRSAVILMKRPFFENLALAMGQCLAEHVLQQTLLNEAESVGRPTYDMLLATPQHWWRRISRRTNSSEHMAEAMARELRIPLHRSWIKRIRPTQKQGMLGIEHRRSNVQGAFAVARWASVQDRSILLVDDILTSGSTAHEIALVLKARGAKRVDVAVAARSLI